MSSSPANTGKFLPAREVISRYGVSFMTLYRWIDDERMEFPPPVYFGRYRYWHLSELEAWERSRARTAKPAGVAA